MSRNLGYTLCDRCGSDVRLEETPRYITPEEAGPYFRNYHGMLVANAVCWDCGARYLAWMNYHGLPAPEDGRPVDLSYRSTFNDEPGPDDLPVPEFMGRLRRWRDEHGSLMGEDVERAYRVLCRLFGIEHG